MNSLRFTVLLFLLALLTVPAVAFAEEDSEVNPYLSKPYYVSAGLFYPDRELRFRLDGSVSNVNSTIDFSEQFKLSGTDETFAAEIGWRFGEKWLLRGQYFNVDDSGRATLTEDLDWGDYTFGAGATVEAGTDVAVARAFFGRRFRYNEIYEAGFGFGLHVLDIGAFIRGEAFINGMSAGVQDVSASASGPLPNFGVWYIHAISPQWATNVRLDWLSVDFDDFDGRIINAALGVNYAITQHVGVGISYNYFELNVGVKDNDWRGRAVSRFDGIYVFLSGYW